MTRSQHEATRALAPAPLKVGGPPAFNPINLWYSGVDIFIECGMVKVEVVKMSHLEKGNVWQFIGLLSHYSPNSPWWLTAAAFMSAILCYSNWIAEKVRQ